MFCNTKGGELSERDDKLLGLHRDHPPPPYNGHHHFHQKCKTQK